MFLQHFNIKIKLLVPVLGIMAVSSCSKDFLDVVPIDRIPKDEFFKTESDLVTAVNGIYAQQKVVYSSGELPLYNLEETRSDNTSQKYGRQTEHRAVDNFTAEAGNNSYIFNWADTYNCINLCNAVIARAPAVEMDETKKQRLIGEAKFIRGHMYFNLVKDYGGVPLRLTETTSLSGDNNLARASVQEVYAQIIKDLDSASKTLPPSYSGADVGRATSGAAFTLLGKAYLQSGNKADAVTALRQVVKPGSLYELLPTYAELWDPNLKNSKESIFEIQFLPPLNGSPFFNYMAPPSLNIPGGNNGNTGPNTPTQDLIDAYEPDDQRLAASIAFDGDNRPYIIKFKDPAIKTGNDANNNFPILRYSDAMLLLAEALGETQESYDLINEVRDRAGLGPISSATPGTFAEKLLHERQVELAFETHRWHDMLRLMTEEQIINYMNTHLGKEFPGQNISIDKHDLLNPIPTTEVQTNSLLEQNPGYL